MQPYYFPFITGHGDHLQGYFDYRPKDINEAIVAAVSRDGGKTWNFQQEVLQLRTGCPTQANKEPDGEKDAVSGNNTITVDASGLPSSTGTTVSVPSQPAVGGVTGGFFAGRVYAPSATLDGDHELNVFFAGYHTPKPKNGLGDYRTIGRIRLHSDTRILDASI